ncbi:unnamed protein product [Pedinophyceae sp. YPF-701]|nr:unnamed protein product [Pedinophyceae sp. YPF-701]
MHFCTAQRVSAARAAPASPHCRPRVRAAVSRIQRRVVVRADPDDAPAATDADVAPQASRAPSKPETPPAPAEQKDPRFKGFKALVVGASGRTGREIVKRLVKEGVPVRAFVRDTAKAREVLPGEDEGVEFVKGDVNQLQGLAPAAEGCNVVFIATSTAPRTDPFGPFEVEYEGTKNVVAAARMAGAIHVVLVSTIGADDPFFFLNIFFGIAFWKKRAEEHLQRSGIPYTIVRPGGLRDTPARGSSQGNIVMEGPNTFGTPPKRQVGSILRSQVADVCVEAILEPTAENRVVEIIASPSEPSKSIAELYRAQSL